jgi:hypothetical protein
MNENTKIMTTAERIAYWINTTKPLKENSTKIKPCKKCGYCPYGCIVEVFPFTNKELSCPVFGHDCPMYYNGENLSEFGEAMLKQREDQDDLGNTK